MKSLLIVLLSLPLFLQATTWNKTYKVKYVYKEHTGSGNILADTTYVIEGKDSVMYTWLRLEPLTYMKTRWDKPGNSAVVKVSVPLIGSGNHPVTIYKKVN